MPVVAQGPMIGLEAAALTQPEVVPEPMTTIMFLLPVACGPVVAAEKVTVAVPD